MPRLQYYITSQSNKSPVGTLVLTDQPGNHCLETNTRTKKFSLVVPRAKMLAQRARPQHTAGRDARKRAFPTTAIHTSPRQRNQYLAALIPRRRLPYFSSACIKCIVNRAWWHTAFMLGVLQTCIQRVAPVAIFFFQGRSFLPCPLDEGNRSGESIYHSSPGVLPHVAGALTMSFWICNGFTCTAEALQSGLRFNLDTTQRQS